MHIQLVTEPETIFTSYGGHYKVVNAYSGEFRILADNDVKRHFQAKPYRRRGGIDTPFLERIPIVKKVTYQMANINEAKQSELQSCMI